MKFKKYLWNLNELAKDRPETLEFDVVFSIDDEGNGFNLVNFEPAVGSYDKDDKEFKEENENNAVCVN
jgi:hypothetical protein